MFSALLSQSMLVDYMIAFIWYHARFFASVKLPAMYALIYSCSNSLNNKRNRRIRKCHFLAIHIWRGWEMVVVAEGGLGSWGEGGGWEVGAEVVVVVGW